MGGVMKRLLRLVTRSRSRRSLAGEIVAVLLLGTVVLAADDPFERTCVACHEHEGVSLRKTFMNALLVYGGKRNMQAGLRYFLRHPRRDSSVMSDAFLDRHGIHPRLDLNDSELDRALKTYWERYKVIGNLH
jgi:hypothetical protein